MKIREFGTTLTQYRSCLYHTINILLNRAMLKLSREPELASAMAEYNPLIQCISSATSIVALFDLYNRTFGDGHVVLSLAYSVYTAASIFLLEVQALGHAASSTLERLLFCLGALEMLRNTNPGTRIELVVAKAFTDPLLVLATASNLITKELEALGIHIPPTFSTISNFEANESISVQPFLPLQMDAYSTSAFANDQHNGSIGQQNETILLDASYLNNQIEGSMNFNLLDMPPEMFEAFTQIEPISVTMNPGFDMH